MASEAFVNPAVLRWARERGQLTADAAAKKLGTAADKLKAWEAGTARPTFRQAQHLAQSFRVPFGYLFLSRPPEEPLPIPDLRTVGGEKAQEPSPELRDLLLDIAEKQRWYRDYQEEEDAAPLPFVGRFTLKDPAERVAGDIAETIGVGPQLRALARSWEDFLRLLVSRCEDTGILVLRSGIVENDTRRKLDVNEFRGFVISDPLAPLIFINGNDAKSGQIFTLVHELAHLWLGISGITDPDTAGGLKQEDNTTEWFCSRVAAEVLLPRDEFRRRWDQALPLMESVETVATAFRVSRAAALRHAYDLGFIGLDAYRAARDQLANVQEPTGGKKTEGGNFYNVLYARNGRNLTNALVTGLAEGRVTHIDAARLLNVKPKSLGGITKHVLGEGAASVA